MSAAITIHQGPGAEAIEKAITAGDLSQLTPAQRVIYYKAVCDSVGLNPLTKPFEYLRLNGRDILYANKGCADQLRQLHGVSVELPDARVHQGVYVVTAHAVDRNGRKDASTGAVNVEGLKGEALANAMMKAETKAKRRVTLSICGLGMLDESEVQDIPRAQLVPHDPVTGEVRETPSQPPPGPGAAAAAGAVAARVQQAQRQYELRAAELSSAPDLPALKKVWDRIQADAKKEHLSFDQRAELAKLKDLRKKALDALGTTTHPAEDDFPASYNKAPGGRVEETASGRTTFSANWPGPSADEADAAPPPDVELGE